MPNFMERIGAEYKAGVAHVFLLHFNVWDIAYDEVYGYLPMMYYLMEQLNVLGCDLVLGYSPTAGFQWPITNQIQQNVMRHLGLAPHQQEIWDADVAPDRPIGQIQAHDYGRAVFTAQHVGRGHVRARIGELMAQTEPILVNPPRLAALEIRPPEATVRSGKQRRFIAVGRDEEGREIYLERAEWTVLVSRFEVAWPGQLEEGLVSDAIRGSFQQQRISLSDRAWITREGENEWRVIDAPQAYSLTRRGDRLQVTVGDIGRIDSRGVFVAARMGVGRLRVRAGNVTGESGPIQVVPGEITSLELMPTRAQLEPGQSVDFWVKARDAAQNRVLPSQVSWEVVPLGEVSGPRRRINSGVRTDKWWEDQLFATWKSPADRRADFNKLVRSSNAKVGLVIDFIEELAPNGELTELQPEQRYYIEDIQRWAMDLDARLKKNIVLMLARNINRVSPALTMNGDIPVVEVPFPNYQERLALIQHLLTLPLQERPPDRSQIVTRIRLNEGFSPEQFATVSAGLNLLGIHDVALRAEQINQPITPELVEQYKRESMRVHSRGLLDVIATEFGVEYVGGMQHVGNYLRPIIGAFLNGETKLVPMGILFLGPPGTGKTFVAQVLARQTGMAFVQLKNMREGVLGMQASIPGMKERMYIENLTMALSYIRALAPVVVFMDEIDRATGLRADYGFEQVDSALPIELANFISDPSHRGSILWIGASNRPDLLDPLFRRRGLFDDRLIFLLPTAAERADILPKLLQKHRIPVRGNVNFAHLTRDELMAGLSGGDLEVIVQRAYRVARRQGRDGVNEQDLLHATQDFAPEYAPEMLEFMSLLALREATSREMLPVQLPPGLASYLEKNKPNKSKINLRLRELEEMLDL